MTGHPSAQATGLVAAYAFDESAGTSVTDASGQGNTGTIQGAIRVSGKYGSALSFNGTSDLVSIASSTSLSPTTGLTIEAWVFPTRAGGWQTAVLKERPGGLVYGFYASDDGARPSGWVRTSSSDKSAQGTASLLLNVWTHIALTYNRSQLLVYVDGALVASGSVTGNLATSTGALRIGGNTIWGEYFQGRIDDVRIYNRALSAAEIVTDLNTPVVPSTPDTEAPSAAVTAPTPGTTVSGTVTVSATATDNIGVAGVQFTLNDANLGNEDTTSPFSIQWNTTGLAPGSYTLKARARDAAGNQGTSSGINVVVSAPPPDTTPPVITISSPANGATVSGPTTLAATASDNVGVVGVRFKIDGLDFGSEDTAQPYEIQWTPGATGTHAISAAARDAAGNTTEAPAILVTVTTPPSVPGLVAAFGFEETSGTTALDASGNGNNGAIAGATVTTGRYGNALNFDGVNDWVTVGDAPSLDLTTGMTLEAWVYPTTLSGYRTVLLKEIPSELSYCLYAHDGSPRPATYVNTGSATDPTAAGISALPLNTWGRLSVRVVVNGASSTVRVRLNGNVVYETVAANLGTSGVLLVQIGNETPSQVFGVTADNISVTN